jgi:rhamnosyltransferase subunit B
MRILITSVGSHGDIHPYVGVGQALRRRGHEVALLAQPYFKRVAEDAGLEFIAVGDYLDLREIAQRPELMGSWNGTKRILQDLIIPEAPKVFHALEAEFSRRRPDVVFTHHICFGVTWACEKHGVPVATGCLSPLAWPAPQDPAHFTPITRRDPSPRAMRWWLRLARFGSRHSYDPPLNRIRRELGLPKGRDWVLREFRSGDINLGLWSRHFRGPIESDPEHGHICGFVWFDRHKEQEHAPEEVERYLHGGEPPIIFTLGTTAVHVAGPFYQAAADACAILKRRGMLLTGHADYAPRRLPAGVAAFTYAPFSSVLPRGCATVHHGGIGTTAQSMRAGRPSVIVPFAHDQFDNAARTRRHGVSATVRRSGLSADGLAAALRSVLDKPEPAVRAAQLGQALSIEHGEDVAAERIEALGAATGSLRKTG